MIALAKGYPVSKGLAASLAKLIWPLLLAKLLWGFASFSLPLALASPSLQATLHAIDPFIGPQDLLPLARQLLLHEPVQWSLFLYDLVWLFGCWLLAVLLFNRRELARRRA